MATYYCTCDLDHLNLSKKDIVISRIPLIYHGNDSARRIELDLLSYMDDYKLDWGNIHHCKLHVDEIAPTAVIFLRFCNPDVHGRVIAEMNGIEWPAKTGNSLRFEFNRKYTMLHQAKSRERLAFHNAQTQTELLESLVTPETKQQSKCDIETQTENTIVAVEKNRDDYFSNIKSPSQLDEELAAISTDINLIDLDSEFTFDKYTPLKNTCQPLAAPTFFDDILKCENDLLAKKEPTLYSKENLAAENIENTGQNLDNSSFSSSKIETLDVKSSSSLNIESSKFTIKSEKIKQNPLDRILSKEEFETIVGGDMFWDRNTWDQLIGLEEVKDHTGSTIGYKKGATTVESSDFEQFSESSSFVLVD